VTDGRFWNALENTVYFTSLSVSLELALGLSIALLLNRDFAAKGLVRAVVLVPWAVPTVVSARMWEWIYNTDFGILNHLLGQKINWLGSPGWAMHAAVLMDVWKTTPFVVILLLAGLQVIPRDLYRAARVDGAGRWQPFRRLTLPLLKPVLLVVLIFRTLDAFRIFDAVYVLTGGAPQTRRKPCPSTLTRSSSRRCSSVTARRLPWSFFSAWAPSASSTSES
jgi:multiple sugar transport system permease protein